jgi:hypothetical protein
MQHFFLQIVEFCAASLLSSETSGTCRLGSLIKRTDDHLCPQVFISNLRIYMKTRIKKQYL